MRRLNSFTVNMPFSWFNSMLFLLLLIIRYTESDTSQCPVIYPYGNTNTFCYNYDTTLSTWTDAYNRCLMETNNGGTLIQLFSLNQFAALQNANIDLTSRIWLGANNFASFVDSNWHWLDGSVVDNSIIIWCSDSTYQTANGTQCAVYDGTRQCITNELCSTLLSAPCVAAIVSTSRTIETKIFLTSRQFYSTTCTNSSNGNYAYWWTYCVLLINWFILFCFVLYLCNRFVADKFALISTSIFVLFSFILIITFAILWGLQYQSFQAIPVAVVSLGCGAAFVLLLGACIILFNRNRIQRWLACIVITVLTIIVECFLMLGVILCIAYCSMYISLTWTSLDKDVIAALLAALTAIISVLYYTAILYCLENSGQDRIHAIRPSNQTSTHVAIPLATTHLAAGRGSQAQGGLLNNTHRSNSTVPANGPKRQDQIERATSPVDERILNQFYSDQPKDMHSYALDGRQYVVYEGVSLTDAEGHRRELTQAMLLQEPSGLREAISNARGSIHAAAVSDEIRQAESLVEKLK